MIRSYRIEDRVFYELQVFGGKFNLFVPEKLIPDLLEDVEVAVEVSLQAGKKGLYLRLEKVEYAGK